LNLSNCSTALRPQSEQSRIRPKNMLITLIIKIINFLLSHSLDGPGDSRATRTGLNLLIHPADISNRFPANRRYSIDIRPSNDQTIPPMSADSTVGLDLIEARRSTIRFRSVDTGIQSSTSVTMQRVDSSIEVRPYQTATS
jgi:hypothetical protein